MQIQMTPSPNHNERVFPTAGGRARIGLIVLHYTDMPDAISSRALMQDVGHKAAAHYMVDIDGTIEQLVEDERRAWHAGKSFWGGEDDINSLSIGIEIQNAGHRGGSPKYPIDQIKSVTALCRLLMAKHHIDHEAVLAHSDIAPARKADPGEWFPWEDLAKHHVGFWPAVTMGDKLEATQLSDAQIPELLAQCGYDPTVEITLALTAFQRHFVPGVFLEPDTVGRADVATRARLIACARHAAERASGLLAL